MEQIHRNYWELWALHSTVQPARISVEMIIIFRLTKLWCCLHDLCMTSLSWGVKM